MALILIVVLAVTCGLAAVIALWRGLLRRTHALSCENADLKTHLIRTGQEVRELTRRLEASQRALLEAETGGKGFMDRLGHELRGPLSVVSGFAGVLAAAVETAPRGREAAGHLAASGERLAALLDRFQALETSLSPAGDLQRLDPVLAARQAAFAAGPSAFAARVELIVPEPVAGLAIRADPQKLDQLLTVLLDNAVRHSPSGGAVRVEVTADDETVRLCVQDEGEGFVPEQAPVLFQPFSEGAGVGLATARRLAFVMGGALEADGRPGKGAAFSLIMPRFHGSYVDESLPQGVILHVAAQSAERVWIRRRLPALGPVSVHTASTGEEGLVLARDLKPDLLLVDVDLPDMTIEAFREQLNEDELSRETPIVTLSSRRGADHGAALIKPVREERLMEAIRAAMGRRPGGTAVEMERERIRGDG